MFLDTSVCIYKFPSFDLILTIKTAKNPTGIFNFKLFLGIFALEYPILIVPAIDPQAKNIPSNENSDESVERSMSSFSVLPPQAYESKYSGWITITNLEKETCFIFIFISLFYNKPFHFVYMIILFLLLAYQKIDVSLLLQV